MEIEGMCIALVLFHALCEAGNTVEQVRDRFPPAGDAWIALTDLLLGIDTLIDALVESAPIEED